MNAELVAVGLVLTLELARVLYAAARLAGALLGLALNRLDARLERLVGR